MFLDIGANIGAYALYVAAFAGPAARIIAVEPQPALAFTLAAIYGRDYSQFDFSGSVDLAKIMNNDYLPTVVTRKVPILSPTVLQWTGTGAWLALVNRALTWEAREPATSTLGPPSWKLGHNPVLSRMSRCTSHVPRTGPPKQ